METLCFIDLQSLLCVCEVLRFLGAFGSLPRMITYKTLKSFIIHSVPLNLTKAETGIYVRALFSSFGANHFFVR